MSSGNVKGISIKEMWQSKRPTMYRELHKTVKTDEIKAYGTCSYKAMELDKHGEKINLRTHGIRLNTFLPLYIVLMFSVALL
jgi:hypothetical protein